MPYLYSVERYARSVATIQELAAQHGRTLEGFLWMAYVMVAVDDSQEIARQRAAHFLGATYAQDFTEFVDRVAVAGTLDAVVDRLAALVRAGANHLVLLPCHDQPPRAKADVDPWLPELLAGVRSATAALHEETG